MKSGRPDHLGFNGDVGFGPRPHSHERTTKRGSANGAMYRHLMAQSSLGARRSEVTVKAIVVWSGDLSNKSRAYVATIFQS